MVHSVVKQAERNSNRQYPLVLLTASPQPANSALEDEFFELRFKSLGAVHWPQKTYPL